MEHWIKFRKGLFTELEVLRMSEELGISVDEVIGKLCRIWCWADSVSRDGNAPGVTKITLVSLIGSTEFVEALEKVGWLEQTFDGVCFPNFDRHMGESAKARALSAQRQRKYREKITDVSQISNGKSNAVSVTKDVTEASLQNRTEQNNNTYDVGQAPLRATGKLKSSEVAQQELNSYIGWFNRRFGDGAPRSFKPNNEYLRLISRCLNDGWTQEDIRLSSTWCLQEWSGTDNEKYLRPGTLLRPKTVGKYIDQAREAFEK